MDKLPSPTWVLAALATLGAPEMAATTARSAPGDPSERVAIHRASPTLPNAEMTEVDEEARTFTVAVVFSAADLEKLPAVGSYIDVTYAEAPGGGPLRASNLDLSKSNVN
jgi:hypothetical protein